LGALPSSTAPDFSKCFFAVNQLAAVSLFAADGDLPAQFSQTKVLQLLAL
jgi:hypothetical protein